MNPRFRTAWLTFASVALPAAGWAILVHSRVHAMTLHCGIGGVGGSPEPCTPQSIFALDRWVLSTGLVARELNWADSWSFQTQYLAGAAALLLPVLFGLYALRRHRKVLLGVLEILNDWLLVLQTMLWNGFLNEAVRLIVQRPRPFVYLDPARHGPDPAHYTSFYSGHTSFSTAMAVAVILIATRRTRAGLLSEKMLHGVATVMIALAASTGVLRVLAGRHFPTDVLAGAMAATVVAIAVSSLHRRLPGELPLVQ